MGVQANELRLLVGESSGAIQIIRIRAHHSPNGSVSRKAGPSASRAAAAAAAAGDGGLGAGAGGGGSDAAAPSLERIARYSMRNHEFLYCLGTMHRSGRKRPTSFSSHSDGAS